MGSNSLSLILISNKALDIHSFQSQVVLEGIE